jgi:predicted NUDIX family NTP pyrophosphohydrolase
MGSQRKNVSAGILLFRRTVAGLEIFLGHPGGPFWKKRDAAAWSIPKGLADEGEELLVAALREFEEETGICPEPPFIELGSVNPKAGRSVHVWAAEGDADPATVRSNDVQMEVPRGSGRWLTFPEIDRCGWFDLDTGREKITPAQAIFIDRLQATLGNAP